ncbi:ribonuclease H family protein [Falsiroseomonas sp. E2-1-a20]|uniref:ribonuclease H family protein n=1 Tax=Falsiroseomonas sp. E2-1-a20 TaxID=3239300 RepID=UPI003F29FE85
MSCSSGREGASQVQIWVDGRCNSKTRIGGWAALLQMSDNTRLEICGGEFATTINRMKMKAALRALELVEESSSILIRSDLQYLTLGMSEWIVRWQQEARLTSADKQVANADLWRALLNAAARHSVSWYWDPSFTYDPVAMRLFQLARSAQRSAEASGRTGA